MVHALTNGRRSRRAAFTLLEVMIVVAIIVILVGLGGVAVFRQYEDSKKDAARITATQLAGFVEQYKIRFGDYPGTLNDLLQPPEGGPYISSQGGIIDPWSKPFQYDPSGPRNNGLKADVWAVAPDGTLCGNWPSR